MMTALHCQFLNAVTNEEIMHKRPIETAQLRQHRETSFLTNIPAVVFKIV